MYRKTPAETAQILLTTFRFFFFFREGNIKTRHKVMVDNEVEETERPSDYG
jgi:hypothetical protein